MRLTVIDCTHVNWELNATYNDEAADNCPNPENPLVKR
jgi:hypothetical protein